MYVVGIHSINAQIAQLPDCLLLAAARYVGVGSVCTINTYLYVPKLKALISFAYRNRLLLEVTHLNLNHHQIHHATTYHT